MRQYDIIGTEYDNDIARTVERRVWTVDAGDRRSALEAFAFHVFGVRPDECRWFGRYTLAVLGRGSFRARVS